MNTPITGRVYHVVDKTTGEVVKVGSTIRSLKQRFNGKGYRHRYKNHFLREVKSFVSSDFDWYERGNALSPFMWHLVASEHLEILKQKTFRSGPLSNQVSPLDQKYFGFDSQVAGRVGGKISGLFTNEMTDGRKGNGGRLAHKLHKDKFALWCSEGGKIGGRKNVTSGHIKRMRAKLTKELLKLGGHIAGTANCHERWHVRRNKISLTCSLCQVSQS